MATLKPRRRMTLLELLVKVEKEAHDLCASVRSNMWPAQSDAHELSRPTRKHSHFPTVLALHNSLDNLQTVNEELDRRVQEFREYLQEIDEHLQRDRDSL